MFRNSMNKDFKFETSGLVWPESQRVYKVQHEGEHSGRLTKEVNRGQVIEDSVYHVTAVYLLREKQDSSVLSVWKQIDLGSNPSSII